MKVLIVSPERNADERLRRVLGAVGQNMRFVRSVPEAMETLDTLPFDLVIVDQAVEEELHAAGADRLSVPALTFNPAALVVDETGSARESQMPGGAHASPRRRHVRHATPDLRSGAYATRRRSALLPDEAQSDTVAADPRTHEMFERIRLIAEADSTVLITGETGSGKEIVARSIHRHSAARHGAFVPVNCGAIPDTLIESELFGHRKGAFTGAVDDRCGLIVQAHGGTLFLDEIGDMSLRAQVVLLRFLDRGEVRRVGDTTVRHVNTRVIAATNRSLREEVRAGRFREDLYYRLSVVTVNVPPLRERPGDIMPLAVRHLERTAARLGKNVRGFAADAKQVLVGFDWPGNVRELQNVVETAVVMAAGDLVTAADLPRSLVVTLARRDAPEARADADARVSELLERFGGNRSRAAAALGISRTTLWRKLRQRGTMPGKE